jgi:hypothetical protein
VDGLVPRHGERGHVHGLRVRPGEDARRGSLGRIHQVHGRANFILPSDIDGATPPPEGTPGYFYTFKDRSFHGGGPDRIELYALDVDPAHPGQSTFTLEGSFRISPFTYTVCGFFNFNCVRQRNTDQRIQVVSEWPMHRFPYINFGDHKTLLGNFTVGGGTGETGAAIRWFELRNTGAGWRLRQQGTYDPGDGNDRFMGSIAMDRAGNRAGLLGLEQRDLPEYPLRDPSPPETLPARSGPSGL